MNESSHRLPEAFVRSVKEQFTHAEAEMLLDSILKKGDPPVSIHLNTRKTQSRPDLEAVSWSSDGYYLNERPIFTQDPLFHAGAYYVQEASSMIIGKVFEQTRQEHSIRILDLCASPGGKSTQLLAKMNDGDLLVANDVVRSRARILMENMVKWGSDQVVITNNDPGDFAPLEGFFDFVLIDAPCSGEGMFRKDPSAVDQWSPENVTLCCGRQKRIIADSWECLAEDGILVYSTCTFNTSENEEILSWLITNYEVESVPVSVEDVHGILSYEVGSHTGYKMLPGLVKGEGFCFFAVKKANGPSRRILSGGKPGKSRALKWRASGLIDPHSFYGYEQNGLVFATRKIQEIEALRKHLTIIRSAVLIGELKKDKLIPSHELALSQVLDMRCWPSITLTYEQALTYLMRETFEITNTEKGFNLLLFYDLPLGWINHLGNRFNSLYPSGWRIQRDFRNYQSFSVADFIPGESFSA